MVFAKKTLEVDYQLLSTCIIFRVILQIKDSQILQIILNSKICYSHKKFLGKM